MPQEDNSLKKIKKNKKDPLYFPKIRRISKRRTFCRYVQKIALAVFCDLQSWKWGLVVLVLYFGVMKNFLYSLCPVVMLTGFPCPACGMTRAGALLLELEVKEALAVHPFIYAFAMLAFIFGVNRYLLFRKTPEWLKWLTCAVMAGMVIYYIWRMYRFFPGEAPMEYYSGILFLRLFRVCERVLG